MPPVRAFLALQLKPAEALDYLQASLKELGEHPDLLRLALRRSYEVGREDECRLHLRALGRACPGDPLVTLMKARLLAREGNTEESNRLWREYRQICQDPERELEYARFLTRAAGKPELAVDVLKPLLADPRLASKALLDLATVYMLLNRVSEAEQLLQPTVQKSDCPSHVLSRYALVLSQLGRLENARAYAERARRLDPADALAREVLLGGVGQAAQNDKGQRA